MKTISVIIETY